MDLNIRCKVYPGQFSGEYAISGTQINGDTFSLFAPEWLVTTEEQINRDRAVDGWLKVKFYGQENDALVIRLPRESLESGRFVTVGFSEVKNGAQAIEIHS